MRNPCLKCKLLHEDKNRPECENCQDRLNYLASPDGRPPRLAKKEVATMKEEEKERVCFDPECKHSGRPQPIENFPKTGHGARAKDCSDCRGRKIREGRERAKAKKPEAPKAEVKVALNYFIVDFTQHPELLSELEKQAKAEFRSPEQQVLWLINRRAAEIKKEAANAQ